MPHPLAQHLDIPVQCIAAHHDTISDRHSPSLAHIIRHYQRFCLRPLLFLCCVCIRAAGETGTVDAEYPCYTPYLSRTLSPCLRRCRALLARRRQRVFPTSRRRQCNAHSSRVTFNSTFPLAVSVHTPSNSNTSPDSLGRLYSSCFSYLHSVLLANPSILPTRS